MLIEFYYYLLSTSYEFRSKILILSKILKVASREV